MIFLLNKVDYRIDKMIQMEILIEEEKNYNSYMSEQDIIKISEKISKKREQVRSIRHLSAPMEVVIYPTIKCNLNCSFCFLNKISTDEINVSEWLKLVEKAKEIGVLSISILGGEPTLYKYIDELIIGIEKIGINTTITTNGVNIKKSTLELLSKSKYIIPVISIQAMSEKNNQLMGVDYINQVNTIKYFVEAGKKVRMNTVYTIQTYKDIYELVDFAIDNKIDRYSIATYFENNDSNTYKRKLTLKDSRYLDEIIQNYLGQKHPNVYLNYSVEGCLLYSAYPEIVDEIFDINEFDKLYYGCRAGNSKIEVYANGDVFPCISFEKTIKPSSNITRKTLDKIWNEDKNIVSLREQKCTNLECIKCGFYNICNGGCPADKMKKYGENYQKHKDQNCCMPVEK